MNPWRKRRRQRLRRQNNGFYTERWISLADICTITFGPLTTWTIPINPTLMLFDAPELDIQELVDVSSDEAAYEFFGPEDIAP